MYRLNFVPGPILEIDFIDRLFNSLDIVTHETSYGICASRF